MHRPHRRGHRPSCAGRLRHHRGRSRGHHLDDERLRLRLRAVRQRHVHRRRLHAGSLQPAGHARRHHRPPEQPRGHRHDHGDRHRLLPPRGGRIRFRAHEERRGSLAGDGGGHALCGRPVHQRRYAAALQPRRRRHRPRPPDRHGRPHVQPRGGRPRRRQRQQVLRVQGAARGRRAVHRRLVLLRERRPQLEDREAQLRRVRQHGLQDQGRQRRRPRRPVVPGRRNGLHRGGLQHLRGCRPAEHRPRQRGHGPPGRLGDPGRPGARRRARRAALRDDLLEPGRDLHASVRRLRRDARTTTPRSVWTTATRGTGPGSSAPAATTRRSR